VREFAGHRALRTARAALRSARPVTLAERVERAEALDRPVGTLSRLVVRALPPGPWTDALHGVPFGQPAHPALVRLPLGCWTSAVLLDRFGGPGAERASATLVAAGVAAAVPAAATGLADWSALHRHQQRVGLVHAISQAGATALFAGSLLARAAGRRGKGRLLAASGLLAALAGGYLGGHLALRLGAGASHAESIRHLGGPLHQGRLTGTVGATGAGGTACVTCPWHGSTFRLSDGAVLRGPSTVSQPTFEARIADGLIQVRPA
jgi:uncharacterized membrane protein